MKSLVVILACAVCCCSIAFAAPRPMSNAALDNISAGTDLSMAQPFITAFVTGGITAPSTSTDPTTTQNPATTTGGAGSQSVSGDSNATAGAVADNGSAAINGDGNAYVPVSVAGGIAAAGAVAGTGNTAHIQNGGANSTQVQTGDIALTLSNAFNTSEATNTLTNNGNGNADFIGNNDTVTNTTDNSSFTGEIGGSGVVARTATVSDSFNTTATTNNVTVAITDSFNTTTNTLSITGQGTVSGIVNANTLGSQNIGTNLNITTATSDVPSDLPAASGSTGLSGFGSSATTTLYQTNVNGSIGVIVGCVTVSLSPGATLSLPSLTSK